ncbi:MAG: dihydrodipicolinate synthase family protein [Clostridia bacterium]|nr:dihydrodipicolinate synthase family protein [Clostridia bacterium]
MKDNFKKGFVPALGTPLDKNGYFIKDSFEKQIELMIDSGAVGLLAMGSMGIQATIRAGECKKVAKAAVDAASGRVPVYVGAMDCSIARVGERIAELEELDIAGLVFTTPYYNPLSHEKAVSFFKAVAGMTGHRVYLYDLAVVTQTKITYEMIKELISSVSNIGGIKTADLNLIRKLMNDPELPAEFEIFYSGLDTFDVAYSYGICTNLDGMFTCTPKNSKKMYDALRAGDRDTAAQCLTNIIWLRDKMLTLDLMPAYSAGMNLLGCDGIFNQDYCTPYSENTKTEMYNAMKAIGEF